MNDVLAVVRKDRFERYLADHDLNAAVGTICRWNDYPSLQPRILRLKKGGRLFLVTVRQPNERLWLVACHSGMKDLGHGEWISRSGNEIPIADITDLKSKLVFEHGQARLTKRPGLLGQSLQTPRWLTKSDSALLDQRILAAKTPKTAKTPGGKSMGPGSASRASVLEGEAIHLESLRRSRDPKLRTACLERDGFACCHCGFRRAAVLKGTLADSEAAILDVHHIRPLKDRAEATKTILTDLLTLCPTCHRVAHAIQARTKAKLVDRHLLEKHYSLPGG